MKALLSAIAVIAVVVILLGIFLKAVKWLIIIGAIALLASVLMGVLQGRKGTL